MNIENLERKEKHGNHTQKSISRLPLPPNSRSPTWNVTVILSSLWSLSWKHSREWALSWMLWAVAAPIQPSMVTRTADVEKRIVNIKIYLKSSATVTDRLKKQKLWKIEANVLNVGWRTGQGVNSSWSCSACNADARTTSDSSLSNWPCEHIPALYYQCRQARTHSSPKWNCHPSDISNFHTILRFVWGFRKSYYHLYLTTT